MFSPKVVARQLHEILDPVVMSGVKEEMNHDRGDGKKRYGKATVS